MFFKFAILFFLLLGCKSIINKLGGDFSDLSKPLSPEAKLMVEQAFVGFENACLVDSHIHIAGLGNSNSGIFIKKSSSLVPTYNDLKLKVYMSASGVSSENRADEEFLSRLLALFKNLPGNWKGLIYAFDYFHDEQGNSIKEKSSFYVPNEYVYQISSQHPEHFVPVISIHPERSDAITELRKWHSKGVHFVKWLPNAQRIDPESEKALLFLREMKNLNMVLITHIGEERAVEGDEFQHLGNPLLFVKALDIGTKIIMAHLGSLGECQDIQSSDKNLQAPCIELFFRLFSNPQYQNNLFGEISGLTIHTRVETGIDQLLKNPAMSARLVNGSDYPLPAVNFIYRTGQIQSLGFISQKERELLNEIYQSNPLLFDFVLKRTIKNPKTGEKIPVSAFLWSDGLPKICN